MGRRNLSHYQVFKQEGVEFLLMPDLAKHTRNIDIDLKKFLFMKNLSATLNIFAPKDSVNKKKRMKQKKFGNKVLLFKIILKNKHGIWVLN